MFDLERLFEDTVHSPTLLAAEIGVNHEGSAKSAHLLIDAAAKSGADAVKFQIFKTEEFIHPTLQKAGFDLFKRFELSTSVFDELRKHARELGLLFFATPLDLSSLNYLAESGDSLVKIASSDLQTYPILKKAAENFRYIILSTGMSKESEVIQTLPLFTHKKMALLYCISLYPAPANQIHLKTIARWNSQFNFPVGFSDHSKGISLSLGAVSLGAKILERHFTLDASLPGADHAISLTPQEFRSLHDGVRKLEQALNESETTKEPSLEELNIRQSSYRTLFAAREVKKGSVLSEKDLFLLRPGTGISKTDFLNIVGQRAKKDLHPYEKI